MQWDPYNCGIARQLPESHQDFKYSQKNMKLKKCAMYTDPF